MPIGAPSAPRGVGTAGRRASAVVRCAERMPFGDGRAPRPRRLAHEETPPSWRGLWLSGEVRSVLVFVLIVVGLIVVGLVFVLIVVGLVVGLVIVGRRVILLVVGRLVRVVGLIV